MIIYICLITAVTICLFLINNKRKIVTIKFSGLLQYRKHINGFWITFLTLSFFSAIRDGIGIDYESYIRHIQLIQNDQPSKMEIGFKALVKVMMRINDDPKIVIIVLSIVTVFFYCLAIWNQTDDYKDAVLIYLTWGIYFLSFNTIRTYLALALCLYSIKYINTNKFKFIAIICLASMFHKSTLIAIPLYLIANIKWDELMYVISTIAIPVLLLSKSFIRKVVFYIYPYYEGTVYDSGRVSWANIIKGFFIVGIGIICYSYVKKDEMNRFYFKCNVLALVVYIGIYWLPEISRIGFLLNATSLFLIPNLIISVDSAEKRKTLKILLYSFSIIIFVLLCREYAKPTLRVLPYRTWLWT